MATNSEHCPLCESFAAPSMKGVVRHIGLVHSHEFGFRVTCGVGGCTRSYTKFSSYKKHMYVKHRDTLGVSTRQRSPDMTASSLVLSAFQEDEEEEEQPYCAERDRSTALFILKACEIHKIPQSSLNHLLSDISTYIDMTKTRLMYNVGITLRQKGITMEDELRAICNSPDVTDPFNSLHSQYLQTQYFIKHFNLVEPVEIRLGRNVKTVVRRSRRRHQISWDYGYYVPLLSSLNQLLSDDLVLSEVLRGHTRNDGLLSDFCDGTAYKSHPLFSQTSHCLELILYYDDVEVCNPLGSRAKTHKLALFYYTLGNLSPKYRSSLQSIHLLIALKSNVLVRYGADKVLQPVLEEIKELESDHGVTFTINGSEYTFRGTVSLFPADNLASQYVGGYKALNAALRKCRQCLAVKEDMQSKFLSEEFEARTRETHANHCSHLGGLLHDHYATTYDLHRDSSLNSLRYFHVTEGLVPDIMHDCLEGCVQYEVKELLKYLSSTRILSLSTINNLIQSFPYMGPDIMHDCLEGCVQYEVKELLKYLSSTRILSLSTINNLIQSFPYMGPDARNRPSPITAATLASSDHALKQTASQMWCLARLLPLMIGDAIPTDDDCWYNFLLLLEMLDYIFAPTLTFEAVAQLKVTINDHHQGFKNIYPTCPIIPKMHYIIHYPDLILRYGPLVQSWCMRFEGKLKDLAHRVKCFKNIPKSLASRHQRLVCYQFATDSVKETLFGPVKLVSVSSLEYKEECASWWPEATHIARTSWVEISGTKYTLQNVVVLDCDLLPQFGIIHDIIINDVHQPFLVCEKLITCCFSPHYHSHEVVHHNPPVFIICKQSELYDYSVLSLYHVGSQFVSLKYYLVEKLCHVFIAHAHNI